MPISRSQSHIQSITRKSRSPRGRSLTKSGFDEGGPGNVPISRSQSRIQSLTRKSRSPRGRSLTKSRIKKNVTKSTSGTATTLSAKKKKENSKKDFMKSFTSIYFQLSEVFTSRDDKGHNLKLMRKPAVCRWIFVATNAAYAHVAFSLYINEGNTRVAPSPFVTWLEGYISKSPDLEGDLKSSLLCSTPQFNYLMIGALAIISSIFHYHQCFLCDTKKGKLNCVRWNWLDLSCAKVFALYLTLCYYKQKLFFMGPSLAALILSGMLKLKGYCECDATTNAP